MKNALVVHPRFSIYGGGENLALHVLKALQSCGCKVTLVSDRFRPREVEEYYGNGLGEVMKNCGQILLPAFKARLPRFQAIQHLFYAAKTMKTLASNHPDLVFTTQAAMYSFPGVPNFHIVYDTLHVLHDIADLKNILSFKGSSPWKRPYHALLRLIRNRIRQPLNLQNDVFIALSNSLAGDIRKLGGRHVYTVFPPCPVLFTPRPKKKQVVQIARMVPAKRFEDFMEIAQLLPEYPFVIVGRSEEHEHPRYLKKIMDRKPENVRYVEAPIRTCPEFLQESKVYLYTSHEPGVNISTVQALGAGCIPVCPSVGGGREIVEFAKAGFTFTSIRDGVEKVRTALETEWDYEELAKRAKGFSAENFEEAIRRIIGA